MIFRLDSNEFDWSELLPSFIESAEENLSFLAEDLMNLDEDNKNSDLFEDIYRRAHNLKGSAYTIGFKDLGDLAHSMENILKAYFQGERTPSSQDIDLLMRGLDKLKEMLDELKKKGWVDDHKEEILELESQFDACLQSAGNENSERNTAKSSPAGASGVSKKSKNGTASSIHQPEILFDSVRVKTVYLEKIMNLLGELVILKNSRSDDTKHLANSKKIMRDFFAEFLHFQEKHNPVQESGACLGDKRQMQILAKKGSDVLKTMDTLFERIVENFDRFSNLLDQLQNNVVNIRMVPFSIIFRGFQRTIRDLAKEFGKEIHYVQEGGETQIDRGILEGLVDPMVHLIRNSIDHGIETVDERKRAGKPEKGIIRIAATQENGQIRVVIEDDGRGIDSERIKETALAKGLLTQEQLEAMTEKEALDLIFESGFSTKKVANQISGRGIGMSVVKQNISKLNGDITIETAPGKGTKFILSLPLTLLISRALLVKVKEHVYVLPTSFVKKILTFQHSDLMYFSSYPVILIGKEAIPLASIYEILNNQKNGYFDKLNARYEGILVQANNQKLILCVDQILEEQGIVAKSLGTHIKHIPKISGSTVLADGSLGLILDIPAILRALKEDFLESGLSGTLIQKNLEEENHRAGGNHILLVEDELATQQLEKSILESAGFHVEVANNGLEALRRLESSPVDLVITDINMPEMDGLNLTKSIRSKDQFSHLPVIVVSSMDNPEDRQKGISVGADAYISKNRFSRGELVDVVKSFME
ncbi:MAG: hybrid sensor histidine kinase/response regulator [Calditrichaeota bacterium]|nr:hybrid sensor histidine kinase/response regulator [Calditrichota bacterium]